MSFVINLFCNIRVVKPSWSFWKVLGATISGLSCFLRHRFDSILLLIFNYFPYSSNIVGKKYLDSAIKSGGAIFISIHAGPYPLAGKILHHLYPSHQLIVPFFHEHKLSFFPIFSHFFPRFGVKVVELGGAMAHVDSYLSHSGSICLFLDAALPIKRTLPVTVFNQSIPLTTGPLFLSQKYHKPIIPLYVTYGNHHDIVLHVLPPLKLKLDPQQSLDAIASTIEQMIVKNLSQWQVIDRFLIR